MKKNRKIARPAPVAPVAPRNVRVESHVAQAFNRLVGWLSLALVAGSVASATVYAKMFFAPASRFELMVPVAMFSLALCVFALGEAFLVWGAVCAVSEKLARGERLLATVRRR